MAQPNQHNHWQPTDSFSSHKQLINSSQQVTIFKNVRPISCLLAMQGVFYFQHLSNLCCLDRVIFPQPPHCPHGLPSFAPQNRPLLVFLKYSHVRLWRTIDEVLSQNSPGAAAQLGNIPAFCQFAINEFVSRCESRLSFSGFTGFPVDDNACGGTKYFQRTSLRPDQSARSQEKLLLASRQTRSFPTPNRNTPRSSVTWHQ